MFADTRLVNLFPVPLWLHAFQPSDAETVNQGILGTLEQMGAMASAETWVSGSDLTGNPGFAPLAGFVHGAAQGVLGHLSVRYESFQVNGLKAVVTPAGGAPHKVDTRQNNILSGLYYVKAPEGGNEVTFHDPKPQTNSIMPQYNEPNPHNSRNADIQVQAGALILFPAWLSYSVDQNRGSESRVSISFDIMLNTPVK